MSIISEFKTFSTRGNFVDLAIGVVIGGAFGNIVSSFIQDVITPMLLQPALNAAHLKHLQDLTAFGTVKYGIFLSSVINFIVISIVLFGVVKAINTAKKKEIDTSPPSPTQEELLTEIRDLLKK